MNKTSPITTEMLFSPFDKSDGDVENNLYNDSDGEPFSLDYQDDKDTCDDMN